MHRSLKSIIPVILFALPLCAGAAEKKLTLTVKGGAGFIGSGGDMKSYFDANRARMIYVGYTGDLGYDYRGHSLDLALAADWRLAPAYGLRLEVGRLSASWKESYSAQYPWGPGTMAGTDTYRLASVPVTLAAVLYRQAGKVGLQFGAGPTVNLARFTYDSNCTDREPNRVGKPDWTWVIHESFDSKTKAALGGQVFASASYPVGRRLSVALEASYRLAPITKLKGTNRWDDTATWTGGSSHGSFTLEDAYVWFSTSVISGQTWHYMKFGADAPSTADESRHFKFNMGGFALRLGIQLQL